jgi:hypothetical protein
MMAKCFDWVMEKLRIYFPPCTKHKRAVVVSSSEPRDTTYDPIVETLKDMILKYSRKRQGLSKKIILRINYFWHGTSEKIIYSACKITFGMAQMRR